MKTSVKLKLSGSLNVNNSSKFSFVDFFSFFSKKDSKMSVNLTNNNSNVRSNNKSVNVSNVDVNSAVQIDA